MNKGLQVLVVTLVCVLLSFSTLPFSHPATESRTPPTNGTGIYAYSNFILSMDHERYAPVKVEGCTVQKNYSTPYNGTVHVMVTFRLTNQSRLSALLSNLSDPQSDQYHRFLTRREFTENFSVSESVYNEAIEYFSQFPQIAVTSYADRISLGISGCAREIGDLFNTTIVKEDGPGSIFFARSAPELPVSIASYISEVTGLTDRRMNTTLQLILQRQMDLNIKNTISASGYPEPIEQNGVQYIYGSDLQVAYDEQSLLNITYPINEVVATILWAGFNKTCEPVGPFVPSNVCAYYNSTLPSYEPHPHVYGVPINGAKEPGKSAAYDITRANVENTLDLEMVGSMAPGARIFNVYGPNCTLENIDAALAFILNPNSTYAALNNVSVITNSWGNADCNNTVWYQYLQEAQARGITVLASSGDSGDDPSSPKYVGSTCDFPSAMAYNNFGVTAVGGDTLTLYPSLHIDNESAWYETSSYTGGEPVGSTGGISTIFREPEWQVNTEANNVIQNGGRGVPDISAIGNNTLMFVSLCTTSGYGSYSVAGTSISSPIEAGIVAEMNAIMQHYNESDLGFLNPQVYELANQEDLSLQTTNTTGYIPTGSYNSTLPTLPFHDVDQGRNHLYKALYGYNLVTGWGSIDAYNMTMYMIDENITSSHSGLRGVEDVLNITNLNVTSYFFNSSTDSYSTVNQYYNASVQQNFFIANQFGAPIYWIQNVIYINGSQELGWTVNYTGWVVYPFYGQYPNLAVYQYNFPPGERIYMPHEFRVLTWLSNLTDPMHQMVYFQVNSHVVKIPVPGAAYIIDAKNYNYSWQGHVYQNGPYPGNPYYGGLDPQFGLVGGPSGGLGIFRRPTSGSIFSYVEPLNSTVYLPAISEPFNGSIDETGEAACSLSFTGSGNGWDIGISNGSALQGIVDYGVSAKRYPVIFSETDLPQGTQWNITVNEFTYSSNSQSISISLPNGTYSAFVSPPESYVPSPDEFVFTVNGSNLHMNFTFDLSENVTYMRPLSTFYLGNGESLPGEVFNLTYYLQGHMCQGMAYDISKDVLFIPEYYPGNDSGYLVQYNVSSGRVIASSVSDLYDVLYDSGDDLLYAVSLTGILYEINPSTLLIQKSLTIPQLHNNQSTIQQNGSFIFALNDQGFLAQIYTSNLTILRTMNISSLKTGKLPAQIYASEEDLYIPDSIENAVMIINVSSGSMTNVSMPSGYEPSSVIQYHGSDLLIGGMVSSYEIFNMSSGALYSGPAIRGTATSSAYDPLSNSIFVFSALNGVNISGLLSDVSLDNGSILATLHDLGMSPSAIFDPADQRIIADMSSGIVSTFSVMHYFNITFHESGLPSGIYWYVNLSNGERSGPIDDAFHSFHVNNGTYLFTVSTPEKIYSPSQPSASLSVNGKAMEVNITFSRVSYNVSFTEEGLSGGVAWYVNLSNGIESGPLTGSSYYIFLVNGSYSYTISDQGRIFSADPDTGSIDVSGNRVDISIVFTLVTYQVTFHESGLPSGLKWYVNITGIQDSGPVTGHSYVADLHNGTYDLTVGSLSSQYRAEDYPSSFTVNGTPVTVNITFVTVNYTLQFEERGLSVGSWYVDLSNGDSGSAGAGYNITFLVSGGSYNYSVSASNKTFYPFPYSGSVSVFSNTSLVITFYMQTYEVNFTERGLQPGDMWFVNLSGDHYSGEIHGTYFQFLLPNGSYTFSISSMDRIYSPSPSIGMFSVSGNSESINVTFHEVEYLVNFTENGLVPGVQWYVNGSSLHGTAISPESISFQLVNGTYSFTVTNLSLFYSTTRSFTVTVYGKNITRSVDYLHWSYIMGTVSPSDAEILVNGIAVNVSPSGSFNISVPNGSYHLIAYASGFVKYYSNFTLSPDGSQKLYITLIAVKIAPANYLMNDSTFAIIAILMMVAVAGSLFAYRRRNR